MTRQAIARTTRSQLLASSCAIFYDLRKPRGSKRASQRTKTLVHRRLTRCGFAPTFRQLTIKCRRPNTDVYPCPIYFKGVGAEPKATAIKMTEDKRSPLPLQTCAPDKTHTNVPLRKFSIVVLDGRVAGVPETIRGWTPMLTYSTALMPQRTMA